VDVIPERKGYLKGEDAVRHKRRVIWLATAVLHTETVKEGNSAVDHQRGRGHAL
jgi:hypothetical protein